MHVPTLAVSLFANQRFSNLLHNRAMQTVYEGAGGIDGLIRLAAAWHERMLADEFGAHPFSHGVKPDHTERLAAYWAESLGGPPTYSQRYGDETSVVRVHSGNGQHEELDQRAIECFDAALDDVALTDPVRQVMHDYFAWATTTSMAHYHGSKDKVPAGMHIPRWSWDGLVD
jgi:hemoglobin